MPPISSPPPLADGLRAFDRLLGRGLSVRPLEGGRNSALSPPPSPRPPPPNRLVPLPPASSSVPGIDKEGGRRKVSRSRRGFLSSPAAGADGEEAGAAASPNSSFPGRTKATRVEAEGSADSAPFPSPISPWPPSCPSFPIGTLWDKGGRGSIPPGAAAPVPSPMLRCGLEILVLGRIPPPPPPPPGPPAMTCVSNASFILSQAFTSGLSIPLWADATIIALCTLATASVCLPSLCCTIAIWLRAAVSLGTEERLSWLLEEEWKSITLLYSVIACISSSSSNKSDLLLYKVARLPAVETDSGCSGPRTLSLIAWAWWYIWAASWTSDCRPLRSKSRASL